MAASGRRRALLQWLRRAVVAGVATCALGSISWSLVRAEAGAPVAELEDDWHLGHRVIDRNGELLREMPTERGRRGQRVELDEIGERLMAATLVSEDRRFYEHDGISRGDILRAGGQNVTHRRLVSGASTVTQQLVKMLDHRGEAHQRTLGVKVDEAMRAQNLERELSKAEILEAYFNRLPYGHGLVGPKAAAGGYFGVEPHQLSWAQAAFLAVLPRAPSYLDPRANPERTILRQRALLHALHDQGHMDDAALGRALAEPMDLAAVERPFHAPHMIESMRQSGELEHGSETKTTIDLALQSDVEGLVKTHLSTLQAKEVGDAAILVVDNENGDILAYVGSADFHDPEIAGQVDMVRAQRQPGSTLKPFVYGLAFENGHFASEMLADVPTRFGEGGGEYRPHNFDDGFLGPVQARDALAGSLNVPAVRLAAEFEHGTLLDRLHALGFDSLTEGAEHYGLALSLGGGEVQLEELAAAYVALARGGEKIPLRKVSAGDEAAEVVGRQVMPRDVAASIAEILADPLARVRLVPGRSPFSIGYDVAVKTGTSSGYRDAWAVGFTHEYTVAVWVGNANGSAMDEVTGAAGAGPLFADVMRRAMRDVDVRQPIWDRSQLVDLEVCALTGKPVGESCPHGEHRWVARDHLPTSTCDAHRRVNRHHVGGRERLTCAATGGEVVALLPESFDSWLSLWQPGAPGKDPFGTEWYSRAHVQGCESLDPATAKLRLVHPMEGSVFLLGPERGGEHWLQLEAGLDGMDVAARESLETVEFVIDGELVATAEYPFRAQVPLTPGDHELRVRAGDPDLPLRGDRIHFSVR